MTDDSSLMTADIISEIQARPRQRAWQSVKPNHTTNAWILQGGNNDKLTMSKKVAMMGMMMSDEMNQWFPSFKSEDVQLVMCLCVENHF